MKEKPTEKLEQKIIVVESSAAKAAKAAVSTLAKKRTAAQSTPGDTL